MDKAKVQKRLAKADRILKEGKRVIRDQEERVRHWLLRVIKRSPLKRP